MTFCHSCGYKLELGIEKFCPRCGTDLQQKVASIGIQGTGGDVIGTGFRGNENVLAKELGGYTREGNVIHFHVNTISYEVLEKIINAPVQVHVSPAYKGVNGDNKDIKEAHLATEINKQAHQFLDKINKIEEKEGGQIKEIKAGNLQISRNDLSLKEIILKGNEHYYKEEYNQAIEWYNKALQIDSNNFVLWFNKGYSLIQLAKYEEAIECYDRAIELEPNYALAWYNKGYALDKLGKYEEAIECYDRAIELEPNYANPWNNKGIALRKLGKNEEAIECCDKALQINPNDAKALSNKAWALDNLRNYEEAIRCYDKALNIKPSDAKAWTNKGITLNKLSEYEKAIECYDKAIELEPNDALAWNNKGVALNKLGKYEEAITYYDKALEIDPNHTLAQNNKTNLLNYLSKQKKSSYAQSTGSNKKIKWYTADGKPIYE